MKLNKNILINRSHYKPKFTIITVVKNDESQISNTIKSVIAQSYKKFEYLIIDGKSKDKTIKQVLKFKKKVNLFISEKDKGIYFAMNKGIKYSKGKIIVFVNSGDLMKKNALRYVNKIFSKNPNYDYVFGTVKRNYLNTSILKYDVNVKRLKYNFDFATSHSVGFFLKKTIFDKYGKFNTKYKCSADYDLYYRIILHHKILGGSTKKNNLIGIVQSGGYSSKISFFSHVIEETRIRLNNNQNFLFVILIFLNALIKGLIKKLII